MTLNLAMDYNFVIQTPLMWLDKSETWELANKLGKFDYVREKTLTCYNGIKGSGCGECPSCKLRQACLLYTSARATKQQARINRFNDLKADLSGTTQSTESYQTSQLSNH